MIEMPIGVPLLLMVVSVPLLVVAAFHWTTGGSWFAVLALVLAGGACMAVAVAAVAEVGGLSVEAVGEGCVPIAEFEDGQVAEVCQNAWGDGVFFRLAEGNGSGGGDNGG